jgi:hypothetical protein
LFLTFVAGMRFGIVVQVLLRILGSIKYMARALLSSKGGVGWGGIHN